MSKSQLNNVLASEPVSGSGEAQRILLLDDSPREAELFCEAPDLAWEKHGAEPEAPRPGIDDVALTAKGAMECLRKPAGRKTNILPDLIVLDLDLSGDTSLTVLRELRRDSRLATLPVIVMAWSDEQSIVRCLGGLGVGGYVVKPMRFDELVALVGGVCRHGLSGNSHQEFCALGSETSSMTILLLGFRRLFDQERQQLLKKQDVKSFTEVPKVVGIGQFGTGASSFVRPGHHAIILNSDGRAGSRRGRDTITIVS